MQIVIDRDRQILYTRSQSGAIGVSLIACSAFVLREPASTEAPSSHLHAVVAACMNYIKMQACNSPEGCLSGIGLLLAVHLLPYGAVEHGSSHHFLLCRCLTWEVQLRALSPGRLRCQRFWLIPRKVLLAFKNACMLRLLKEFCKLAASTWCQTPCSTLQGYRCMPKSLPTNALSAHFHCHILLAHVWGGCKNVSIRLANHLPGPFSVTAFAGQSPASSALVMIAPVPPSVSLDIHLMALTADGRRFYLSTLPPGTSLAAAPGRRTPSVLRNVRSRSAVPAPQHQGQSRCSDNPTGMISTL